MVNKVPVEGKVETTRKKSGEVVEQKEETIPLGVSTQDPAKPLANVGMRIGRTVKTGNYETATVQVMLNVPCELAETDDAFDAVESWIHDKLGQAFKSLGLIEEE